MVLTDRKADKEKRPVKIGGLAGEGTGTAGDKIPELYAASLISKEETKEIDGGLCRRQGKNELTRREVGAFPTAFCGSIHFIVA